MLERFPSAFHSIPWIALGAALFFTVCYLFFSGRIAPGITLCDRPIFCAFRQAKVWHYAVVLALRAPLVLAGVVVYRLALGRPGRFGRDAGVFTGDLLWRGSAQTDAFGRDSFLGFIFSGSAGPDDRLRLRHAQFLHIL
jgi:hypothetical protein